MSSIDSKRERLRQRANAIKLLHLTGLVPQGFVIEHLYYGVSEDGTRGLSMSFLRPGISVDSCDVFA